MVLTFFALLSLSARELVYTDLYIRAKHFWMVTLLFGGLSGLGLAAFLFKSHEKATLRVIGGRKTAGPAWYHAG